MINPIYTNQNTINTNNSQLRNYSTQTYKNYHAKRNQLGNDKIGFDSHTLRNNNFEQEPANIISNCFDKVCSKLSCYLTAVAGKLKVLILACLATQKTIETQLEK